MFDAAKLAWQGVKFGLLLQLAIGPVCLFIFNLATTYGLAAAFTGVLAVTLIDGLEMALVVLGLNKLINSCTRAKQVAKYLGTAVLLYFGLHNLLAVFKSPLPTLTVPNAPAEIFLLTCLLTLANPLTMVFWTGVFSSKLVQDKLHKQALQYFAFGCLLATLAFLTLIALIGSQSSSFLPAWLINLLQALVGLALLFFALRNLRA